MRNLYLVLIVGVILISGCTSQQSNQQSNFFLTKDEMKSIGLDLKYDIRYENIPGSQITLYSNLNTALYFVITDPDAVAGGFEPLSIKVHYFESSANLDEVYKRWSDRVDDEDMIEENTFGEKSYFILNVDEFWLVFAKKDYIIRIEADEEIGEDNTRNVGKRVENKIK